MKAWLPDALALGLIFGAVASKKASELYSKAYAIVAHPDVKNIPPNYPAMPRAA